MRGNCWICGYPMSRVLAARYKGHHVHHTCIPTMGTMTLRQCAEHVLTTADGNNFLMRTFQSAMAHYGFTDRLETGREFRRLVNAGRIIKAGECGLAFTYKVKEAQ